jgi:hypothetical protein
MLIELLRSARTVGSLREKKGRKSGLVHLTLVKP